MEAVGLELPARVAPLVRGRDAPSTGSRLLPAPLHPCPQPLLSVSGPSRGRTVRSLSLVDSPTWAPP